MDIERFIGFTRLDVENRDGVIRRRFTAGI
jgi:hypothetical protein